MTRMVGLDRHERSGVSTHFRPTAALETRKAVDRAKAVLMGRYRLSEDAAHRMVQKMSMEKNKPLREIATAIIMAAELPDQMQ